MHYALMLVEAIVRDLLTTTSGVPRLVCFAVHEVALPQPRPPEGSNPKSSRKV